MTELSEMARTGVVSAVCLTAGTALLVAALLVRCLYAWWVRTAAVHLVEDGRHRLRWHTTRYEIHEEPWPRPPAPAPEAGAEVTVYYHARDPHRWALVAPYRWLWLLAAAGTLLVAAGLLTRLVQG
ncbi:UNVERIFIED_CONTAM: hypothetical protein RF653_03895 [Kocuria sp. CPCC 205316]|uniref:hypothetical protein n=1 Tax=Kocuria TaxID=57493 RepID=UPI0036D816C0